MSSLDLIRESDTRLRKIVYNETISTHLGAEVRGISFGRSKELSIRPYTDRELVDEFKRYVSILSRHYGGVVICVDELDKITDAEALKEFRTKRRICSTSQRPGACSYSRFRRTPCRST